MSRVLWTPAWVALGAHGEPAQLSPGKVAFTPLPHLGVCLGSQGRPAHTSAQCEEPARLQNLASLKHPSPGISRYSPFHGVLSIEPSHRQLSDFNVC